MLFAFTVSYPRDVGFDNHSLKIERSHTINNAIQAKTILIRDLAQIGLGYSIPVLTYRNIEHPIISPATDRLFTVSIYNIKVSNTGYAYTKPTMPPQKDMEPYSRKVRYLFGNSKINWSAAYSLR